GCESPRTLGCRCSKHYAQGGLFGRKNFRVGRFGCGGVGDDVEGGIDVLGYGGQADFGAAGLVAEFQGNVLGAERGAGENGERQENGDVAGVDIELFVFREGEGLQRALGISDFAEFEAGGNFGVKIGADQIVLGDLAGVDVKAGANFHDHGNLQGHAAGDGIV